MPSLSPDIVRSISSRMIGNWQAKRMTKLRSGAERVQIGGLYAFLVYRDAMSGAPQERSRGRTREAAADDADVQCSHAAFAQRIVTSSSDAVG
jgi:hypothetical protein